MARIHVFADEAGNFDFNTRPGASRYFILTTVTTHDCSPGDRLLALRRDLAWRNVEQATQDFHATEEKQAVRDEVFAELASCDFRIDASIWEKAKVDPGLAASWERFYKTVWFYHFRYIAPRIAGAGNELMVLASSIGTRKKASLLHSAVDDVVAQSARRRDYRTEFWACASDPCLWVADYASWAIQRKWESGNDRSHVLIASKIGSEFEFTRRSQIRYY